MQRRCFTWACRRGLPTLLIIGSLTLGREGRAAEAEQSKAVGYYGMTLPTGHRLIANSLFNNGLGDFPVSNSLNNLFRSPLVESGTLIIKFDGRNWLTNEMMDGSWTQPEMTLLPGEAAIAICPNSTRLVMLGEFAKGDLAVFVPAGHSLRGSIVPQGGKLTTDLKFPLVPGTKIMQMDTAGTLSVRATATAGGWVPAEPTILLGEGIYIDAPQPFVWRRTFIPIPEFEQLITVEFGPQPQGRQIQFGDTFTLTSGIAVPADATPVYQWQLNGYDIPGATNPELTVTSAGVADLGSYWLRAYVKEQWAVSEIAKVELAPSEIPRLAVQLTAGGGAATIGVQQTHGRPFTWQHSSDLVHWTDLPPTDPPVQPTEITDTDVATAGLRFYRVRLP